MQGNRKETNAIIIHHTAIPHNGKPQYQRVVEYQTNNGWDSIGYHGLIEQDGRFVPGRGMEKCGGHSSRRNADTLGLAFAGDFTQHIPTPQQIATGRRIVAQWQAMYGGNLQVLPHKAIDNTACPGSLNISLLTATNKVTIKTNAVHIPVPEGAAAQAVAWTVIGVGVLLMIKAVGGLVPTVE